MAGLFSNNSVVISKFVLKKFNQEIYGANFIFLLFVIIVKIVPLAAKDPATQPQNESSTPANTMIHLHFMVGINKNLHSD